MTIAMERILAWKLLPRYDGCDVLRISRRLKLVYDAAARGDDIPSPCAYWDCDGRHDRCLCGLAGA